MNGDSKWASVQVGNKLVRNKAQINLNKDELYQMQDVEPIHEVGSLGLRRAHQKVITTNPAVRFPEGMAEQSRLDGAKTIAVVGRPNKNGVTTGIRFVDSDNGTEIDPTTIGTAGNIMPVLSDNHDHIKRDIGVVVSPDAIRTITTRSRQNLGWYGRLNHVFPDQRFNDWNFSNRPNADEITSAEEYLGSINDLSPNQTGVTLTVISGGDQPNTTGLFDYGDSAAYAYSLVWEGGQESELSDPVIHTNSDRDTSQRFNVTFRITDFSVFPKRIRSVRIYRSLDVNDDGRLIGTAVKFYLLKEKFIYESDQVNLSNSLGGVSYDDSGLQIGWDFSGTYALFNTIDYPSYTVSRTYFDNTRLHQTIKNTTPARAKQWNFSDRSFATGVVDENGAQWNNRLYYSHYNGFGLHCRDIFPPANFIQLETINNIYAVIEAGSHRIIIGDTNYASGYITGDITNWQMYQGETQIGCVAKNSIAKSPVGAIFLGRDGIYIVSGSQFDGPYGREVFWDIEQNADLSNAIGRYSQRTGDYFFYIPDVENESRGIRFYAFNTHTKLCRSLSHSFDDKIRIMCDGADGGIVFLTERQISRLETSIGVDDPEGYIIDPIIETGYLELVGEDKFQRVKKVGMVYQCAGTTLNVTVKGFPSGKSRTVQFPERETVGYVSVGIPEDVSIDKSHSIKIERTDKAKTLTALKIQDIEAMVTQHERELS